MPDGDDMVKYRYSVPRDLWEEWKDTVPRSMPLYEAHRGLLRQDVAALDTDEDVAEAPVEVFATRIRHRARTAANAAQDGDTETVRQQCEEIAELTQALER